MKRVLVFIFALVVASFIVYADCGDSDINRDGLVNSGDVNRLSLQYGRADCSGYNSFCNGADVNQDGRVDVGDLGIVSGDFGEDCWEGDFDNCGEWDCDEHSCRYTSCDDDHKWKHHNRNYRDRYDNYFPLYVPAVNPETTTKIIYVPQSSQPAVKSNSVDFGLGLGLILYVMLGLIVLLLLIILVVVLVRI